MAVDRAIAYEAVICVNFFHKLLTAIYAPWIDGEDLQQLEFHSSETQVMSVERGPVAVFIQNESVRLNCLSVASPSKDCFDPRNDFARAERLADVVIGPELKPE